MAAGLIGHGFQLDIRRAAQTPKQHRNTAAHIVETHSGIREALRRIHARGQQMPQLADGFLGLPRGDVEMGHRLSRSLP